MNEPNAMAWNATILQIRKKAEESICALGIPTIKGDVIGHGCCFIKVSEFDFLKYKHIITTGSICVIDADEPSTEDSPHNKLCSLHVYVRLGFTSTWLYYELSAPEDEDDSFSFDEDEAEALDNETIVSLSLRIAQAPGFGSLKNKNQRLEFTQNQLQSLHPTEISEHSAREIASRAESYHELGFLPLRAKSLQSEDKSITEIAKILDISKSKAEKATTAQIPIYIAEKIKL